VVSALSLSVLAGSFVGVLGAASSRASAADGTTVPGATSRDLTIHWMVDTSDLEKRFGTGTDWQAQMPFGDLPMRRDMVCLYEHWFASDVRSIGVSVTKEADYYTRYARTIEHVLNERVPQGFEGAVCIDIEFLTKFWGDRTNGPGLYPTINYGKKYYDEWYDYIRIRQPDLIQGLNAEAAERVLAETFEAAVREWFTFTINKMKELRPGTKFGFYGLPYGCRHGQYARPDPNPERQANDRLNWMVEIADVQFLPVYQNRFTVPDGQRPANWHEMTIAQSRAWISDNIDEARRLDANKPVYVLAFSRYPNECIGHENEWLDDLALDSQFRYPKEAGADGIVIWDFISNEREYNELRTYLTDKVFPILNQVATRPPAPPTPPGGGGETPPAGGGETPPAGGGETPPAGGGETPPAGGGETPPAGGGETPPAGGGETPPAGGGETPPAGGGETPPAGGGETPPAGGGETPPAGGGETPPAGGGETPPAGGGETPPAGGGVTPPAGGGETPPAGGGETPPAGGGETPPAGGGETPPAGGGETPPTGGGGGGGGEVPPTGGGGGGGGEVPPTGGGGSGSGGGVAPPPPAGGGGGSAGGSEPPRTPTASKNTPTRRLGVTRSAKQVTSRPKAKVVSSTTPLKRLPFQVRSLSVPRSMANRTTKVVPLKQKRPTDLPGTTASVPDDR
jgi:hypothetical protein